MQLSSLLGCPSAKAMIKQDFTRYMAQPFMQLHAKWMRVSEAPHAIALASCVGLL